MQNQKHKIQKTLILLVLTLSTLQTTRRPSKCRGLNIGKKKSGHSVIYNGNISPLFTPSSPLYHHQTFKIENQDIDYFYISGQKNFLPKIEKIILNQNESNFVTTAYRVDFEGNESVLSVLYFCNPILSVSVVYELVLRVQGCGDVRIKWNKSCGDLNLPLLGFSVEILGFKEDYLVNEEIVKNENGYNDDINENDNINEKSKFDREFDEKKDVKVISDGQQILFQKNMIMGEIPLSFSSNTLTLKLYLEKTNLFSSAPKSFQNFLQKIEEDSGLFQNHLEMNHPKLTYNEEEIEISLNKNIINEKFLINSKGAVLLHFDIKCKLDFSDTLIEMDFLFIHGQRISLHFSKDCENLDVRKETEVIPYLGDDGVFPIFAKIENRKAIGAFFGKLWKFFVVLGIVVFVGVFFKGVFGKVRGRGFEGFEKVGKKEDDELKTVVDCNLSYGTI